MCTGRREHSRIEASGGPGKKIVDLLLVTCYFHDKSIRNQGASATEGQGSGFAFLEVWTESYFRPFDLPQ